MSVLPQAVFLLMEAETQRHKALPMTDAEALASQKALIIS
jgi:hypothetical protein